MFIYLFLGGGPHFRKKVLKLVTLSKDSEINVANLRNGSQLSALFIWETSRIWVTGCTEKPSMETFSCSCQLWSVGCCWAAGSWYLGCSAHRRRCGLFCGILSEQLKEFEEYCSAPTPPIEPAASHVHTRRSCSFAWQKLSLTMHG